MACVYTIVPPFFSYALEVVSLLQDVPAFHRSGSTMDVVRISYHNALLDSILHPRIIILGSNTDIELLTGFVQLSTGNGEALSNSVGRKTMAILSLDLG